MKTLDLSAALTLALLAALVAAPASAQPAAHANPHAFKEGTLTPECQKLRDEYIKSQHANQAAHGDAHDDGERAKGGHPEQKAMRKDFEARCGALPPEMTPKTKDDVAPPAASAGGAVIAPVAPAAAAPAFDACKAVDHAKDFAEKGKLAQECEKQKQAAKKAAQATTTAAAAAASAPAPAPLPKKAGPATGSSGRYDEARCAQLHQSMKDALARKDACGTDKGCKQTAQSGYEQIRTAYQSGCGEVPADAKPAKKG